MPLQKNSVSRKKQFVTFVENAVTKQDMTYIDAIVSYCETNKLEPNTVTSLIPKLMKEKIKVEAQDLNFIPGKTTKLFE